MTQYDDSIFKKQARVLKALANESRLKIVDRLSRGDDHEPFEDDDIPF